MSVYVAKTYKSKTSQEYEHAGSHDEQLGVRPTGTPPITRGSGVLMV